MILRVDGRTRCGAVVDVRDCEGSADADCATGGAAVAAAVRGEPSPCGAVCPAPGPVHECAGHVHPGLSLSVRPALAAAARSRGLSAPQDDALAEVREELATFDESPADGPASPTDADAAPPDETEVERLREEVAALRGRVRTLTDQGRDADDERERLREAAARLSELTTERVAAAERRRRDRRRRDRRERRLRLQDRESNLARDARAHLVDHVREAFADAVADRDPTVDDRLAADDVTAALAVLRVADVRAPVVLAVDRFADPARAARWLDAPVVRV